MNTIPNEVKQLKEWLAQEKKALAAAGITTIVGEYSGSGDEGNFNGVFVVGPNGFPSKYELPQEIEELIEKVTDIVAMPDYEIDDGGGGSITLDVEIGAIVHESYDLMVDLRSSHGKQRGKRGSGAVHRRVARAGRSRPNTFQDWTAELRIQPWMYGQKIVVTKNL